MYSIQARMSENYSTNEQLNKTLDSIDAKIVALARCKSNNIIFDTTYDADLDLYDDLTTYRTILLNKLLGCNCLDNQRLIKIVSRIKKLTR